MCDFGMTSFASEKNLCKLAGCTLNVQSANLHKYSSQASTPPGGMRCSLNIPGHPIIASKNVIMLPSNEMEKTATSDDYISNHFQDTTLLCSLISRNKSPGKCLIQT